MDMHAAFMEDIIANPEDDTPRLVYADWLEENGDPKRAEFIRVQIEAARLVEDDPMYEGLATRAEELLQRDRDNWFGDLAGARYTVARGFPASLKADALWFAERGSVPQYPLRHVMVRTMNAQSRLTAGLLDRLSACNGLERITDLEAYRPLIGPGAILAFLREARVSALECLSLVGTGPGVFLLDWLAHPYHQPRFDALALEGAEISGNAIGNFEALLPRLRVFSLKDVPQSASIMKALGQARDLSRLRELRLNYVEATAERLRPILTNRTLGDLEVLDLSGNHLGVGLVPLLTPGRFPKLRSLYLYLNGCSPDGVRALCNALPPSGMEALSLAYSRIGDEGAAHLAACPALSALNYADLRHCGIEDAGTMALAQGTMRARTLLYSGNPCSPDALARLKERAKHVSH
jgi:uncharacterized protein (TIGR02996 family)